jgi:hypothetical protein
MGCGWDGGIVISYQEMAITSKKKKNNNNNNGNKKNKNKNKNQNKVIDDNNDN